ncbi:hypothetical protein PHABIO_315 [Pseudomonas phage Phabio]|uniref:Uncharacterized protein n=1 Tax=Pseudomonas phage Phabio TaxID=2006668 RepID=A0A1Y0SZ56_9CAUD|nr:hypothetical protein MZD05_gp315 [Pseudomonas phage Phabio]ARV76946.1 hypothetical protein PHABIO_315 [Pseudomonas phage Phabio]
MFKRLRYLLGHITTGYRYWRTLAEINKFEEDIDRTPFLMINGYTVLSLVDKHKYHMEATELTTKYRKLINKRTAIHEERIDLINKL